MRIHFLNSTQQCLNLLLPRNLLPLHARPLLHIPHLTLLHICRLAILPTNPYNNRPPLHPIQTHLLRLQLRNRMRRKLHLKHPLCATIRTPRNSPLAPRNLHFSITAILSRVRKRLTHSIRIAIQQRPALELVAQDLLRVLADAVGEFLEDGVVGGFVDFLVFLATAAAAAAGAIFAVNVHDAHVLRDGGGAGVEGFVLGVEGVGGEGWGEGGGGGPGLVGLWRCGGCAGRDAGFLCEGFREGGRGFVLGRFGRYLDRWRSRRRGEGARAGRRGEWVCRPRAACVGGEGVREGIRRRRRARAGLHAEQRLPDLGLRLLLFSLDLLPLRLRTGLGRRALCNAHAANAPHAALLPPARFAAAAPDVKASLVAREMVGQVAVELQQEAEQAVAYFALCKRARGGGLVVYPALWQGLVDILLVWWSTYRRAANV